MNMRRSRSNSIALLLAACICAFGSAARAAPGDKPAGANCQAAAPPADAGEESGHGMLIQVYPRISDIGPGYTGCQAVFVTTASESTRLAWLIELVDGDPVRRWSSGPEPGKETLCQYRRGLLAQGDPRVCKPNAPQLMPSQAAGCVSGKRSGALCEYDGD